MSRAGGTKHVCPKCEKLFNYKYIDKHMERCVSMQRKKAAKKAEKAEKKEA